jgi:flagellar motor component MotA
VVVTICWSDGVKSPFLETGLRNVGYDSFPESISEVIQNQLSGMRKHPMSANDLLNLLEKVVPTFVDRLRSSNSLFL